MNISVVIPTCDRPKALRACLTQLQSPHQTYPQEKFEIIVSDDSRSTSACAILENEFPSVKWIKGPCRGPAANRNTGAAAATGDVIVFLDDDCLPQPELLTTYANAFKDPAVTAAEGRIRADREKRRMDEEAPVNEFGGCFWSCNIAIRRDFFHQIRGFDERFPKAAMEDVELRERILRHGNPIPFLPEALVIHPLRLVKGWKSLRARAESHGIYILIPGCHLPPPSYREAVWGTLRKFLRQFLPEFRDLRGKGALVAGRKLLLPLWSTWHMKKAIKRAKSRR